MKEGKGGERGRERGRGTSERGELKWSQCYIIIHSPNSPQRSPFFSVANLVVYGFPKRFVSHSGILDPPLLGDIRYLTLRQRRIGREEEREGDCMGVCVKGGYLFKVWVCFLFV